MRNCTALLLAAAVWATSGCGSRPSTLARVGGQEVTIQEFSAFISLHSGQPLEQTPAEVTSALLRVFLEEEVILASAGEADDRTLPLAVRSARARELVQLRCPPPPLPTIRETEEYLLSLGEEQESGERIRLRQLILSDLPTARNVRQRLMRGESFEAISASLSRAPNAADGGMLGWFGRQQLPPEFEAAVFGLQVGQFSQPVASNAGWHVFHVMERQNATAGPSATTLHRARAELAARIAHHQEQACLKELAGEVGVKVHCKNVSFPCHNPFEESL